MRKLFAVLALIAGFGAARMYAADAPDNPLMETSLLEKQDSLRREAETKIKKEILDPILGADRSFVFADVELEVIAKKAEQTKEGLGIMQKYKEKGAGADSPDTDFILPGIPKPRSVLGGENKRPEAASGQQAQQAKGVQEIRYGVETEITRFQLTVIHDETLQPAAVKLARERVDDFLLPYKIRKKDAPTVLFKPTKFKAANPLDDLKKPSVYLPLLYALLFLLLLLFLFGPLWGFFRKYIKALMAKPGAEVNIEDKREEGGGGSGEDEGKQETEGHQSIDMNFLQKEEEKKGGAVWLSSGAGSPGVLVRGAGSIASGGPSGLLGSARIAQVLANSFGRASWIGGLFASPMGPLLVLGGELDAIFPPREVHATVAAYGMLLRDPLNPALPDEDQVTTSPLTLVTVMIVLLKVARMVTTPMASAFFLIFFTAGAAPAAGAPGAAGTAVAAFSALSPFSAFSAFAR